MSMSMSMSMSRSSWGKRRRRNAEHRTSEDSCDSTIHRRAGMLFISQRFDRIEPGGEIGGDQRCKRTNYKRADANLGNVDTHNLSWYFRELVDFSRKNLDVQCGS